MAVMADGVVWEDGEDGAVWEDGAAWEVGAIPDTVSVDGVWAVWVSFY